VRAAVEVGGMSTRRYKAPRGAQAVGERVALAQDVWAAARRLDEALWQAAYMGVDVQIKCARISEPVTRIGATAPSELVRTMISAHADELAPVRAGGE